MNIYLKNIETNKIYSISTEEGVSKFEFNNLPSGNYIAYAYTKENLFGDANTPNKEKGSGGYSKAVQCGLKVGCNDHELIVIELTNGKTARNVEICDWYGANVPKE